MATFLGTVRNPIRILTRGIYKRGGDALWLYRTIQRKLRQRGVLGTARYALVVFLHLLLELRPSRFRTRAIERAARRANDAAFDRPYGVDTGSDIFPTTMPDSESDNRIYDAGYEPSSPDLFEEVFRALDIDPHYYTFIDYGSGKGRVLLLASRLPFRRVVGVEYSPMLHRIAEQNLHLVGFADRRSGPVESVCMDAVSFPIPEEPVILYFFNPFGRPIMERVRNNVVRSYQRHPRCIVVIYLNPVHSDVWDAVEFLRKHLWSTVEGRAYVIYKVGY
jgi:predicted RNA methylase